MEPFLSVEDSHVDILHEISVRLATADGFHEVLTRVVEIYFRVGQVRLLPDLHPRRRRTRPSSLEESASRSGRPPETSRRTRYYGMGGGASRARGYPRRSRARPALPVLPRVARRQLRGVSVGALDVPRPS